MALSTSRRIAFLAALAMSFLAIMADEANASATYSFTGSTPDPIGNVLSMSSPQVPVTATITYSPDLTLISTFPYDPVSPIGGATYMGSDISITLEIGNNSVTSNSLRYFQVSGGSIGIFFTLPSGGSIEFAGSPIIPALNNNLPPTLDVSQFSTAWINYIGPYAFYNGAAFIPLNTPSSLSPPTPAPEPSTLALVVVGVTAFGIHSARRRRRSEQRSKMA